MPGQTETKSSRHACLENEHRAGAEVPVASLSMGGQLFVWSLRRWRLAIVEKEPLDGALAYTYGVAGCPEAVPLIDEVLSLVAVSAFRPFAIRCVRCQRLSADEWLVLRALQEIQRGDEVRAAAIIGKLVAGRLGHAFCRSAKSYVEALDAVGVMLCGANLQVIK